MIRQKRVLLCAAAALMLGAAEPAPGAVLDIAKADVEGLSFDPVAMAKGVYLFSQGMQIYRNLREREAAHAARLKAAGIAEIPASRAAARYRIDTGGFGRLLVDDWGELYIDRRFLTVAELKTVKEIEAFVWDHVVTPLSEAKLLPNMKAKVKPQKLPPRVHAGKAQLPIFRGFEDARYQEHDELIARLTAEFNRDKAKWCGGSAKQAAAIKDLTPALVKSHLIEESGGNDSRSKAAWKVDPQQVNVPGDWGDEKELVGLKKPKARNEGTLEQNVRAAIMYLSRKGFTASARPAAERPQGFFDGWKDALRRYNGLRDRTDTNRYYSEEYSDKIIERAENPDRFVPIEIKLSTSR